MYVRILKGRFDPADADVVEALEDEVARLYTHKAGCVHVHFFGDRATGWYGNASVWESEAAMAALGQHPEMARLVAAFAPYVVEPVTVEVYPLYRPRDQATPSTTEKIHLAENDPRWNMPYTPAIKVHGGKMLYLAGVTAAPIYHSHPHVAEEFDDIPTDAGKQTEMTVANLKRVLAAAGGQLTDIIELTRFIVDQEKNQDAINRVMARHFGDHRPASTSVEIVRLATDPRLVLELKAVAVVPE